MPTCHSGPRDARGRGHGPRLRRMSWPALAINAAAFVVEFALGLLAQPVSLQADSPDFVGDAANYAPTLSVLGMTMRGRAGAALVKGGTMGRFGIWITGQALWKRYTGTLPGAIVMGTVGGLALTANLASAVVLCSFRRAGSDMRSARLRNDAVAGVTVMLAASGVYAPDSGWPVLPVAAVLAALAPSTSFLVPRQATGELRVAAPAA